MRVLITGITGMAGSHLAEYLVDHHPDVEVFGTFRWRSRLENLHELRLRDKLNILDQGQRVTDEATLQRLHKPGRITVVDCELQDSSAVRHVISSIRPDRIFHLAAQSFVPASWSAPAATLTNNTVSQVNIFEAVRDAKLDPLIHIAGSSEEYGMVYPDEAPIKESNPLRPLSPYAVSKVTQEMLATQYHQSYGLKCVVTRGFNHTGPRRGQVFVTSSFAKQVAEIEAGLQEPIIYVGDLESRRDWSDVRDVVRGYWMALDSCEAGGVYNVGRGECVKIGEMLDILLGHTRSDISVEPHPSRMRPSDVKLLWANIDKFQKATSWEPRIPFETTMLDLLNYWRERVQLTQREAAHE